MNHVSKRRILIGQTSKSFASRNSVLQKNKTDMKHQSIHYSYSWTRSRFSISVQKEDQNFAVETLH